MPLALLLLLTMLPLQWFVIGAVPLGQGRFHLVAMCLFLAFVGVRLRARAALPVARVAAALLVAQGAIVVTGIATSFYNNGSMLGPVQDAIYAMVAVAVGTVIYRLAREEDLVRQSPGDPAARRRWYGIGALRFAAALTVISVLVALSWSMAVNGVNAGTVFARTLASADPNILQRELFRSAFGGFGFDPDSVQGNIRHEVFAAVLCSMYVSAWAAIQRPPSSVVQMAVYRTSIILGTVLLVVSMSRSVLIAAIAWPLLAFVRVVLSGRLAPRHLIAAAMAFGLILLASVAGFAAVLLTRFTEDTSSYEARDGLMEQALANIRAHFFTGGADTAGASAHNFVLDSWQRTGVVGGLLAAFITVGLIALLGALTARLGALSAWMLPVTAALVLPIVRIFTAGGGAIPPVEWVVLGFVAGALAAEFERSKPSPMQLSPPLTSQRRA